MQLVGLVEGEDHVCCRYRLAALRPLLAAAGHTLTFRSLPRSWAGRLTLGRGLTDADAVIVQRKLLPRVSLALLRRRVRRLIFDFDDAVWVRDSYSVKGFADPKRARRFRAVCGAADLVVAGNEYLAAEARRWAPGRVVVVPTVVDVAKYAPQPKPPRAEVQLVWVGSSSTLRGLERFTPTLSAIGRAVPGVRLKLVCDRFVTIPDLPVGACVWAEATEPAEIAAADIGIGWVPDDPWSRGKCGLKVLQYQAAGLPVVANPVGVQADFVRDGETGFAATTTEEWVGAVKRLAADAALRTRLGAAGRAQVELMYSVAAAAARWGAALEELASARAA
ncbi:glycosyltransferase family 4 protein [bacterium]|nr:glycosyltransferase family 4 protein [bacterium]